VIRLYPANKREKFKRLKKQSEGSVYFSFFTEREKPKPYNQSETCNPVGKNITSPET